MAHFIVPCNLDLVTLAVGSNSGRVGSTAERRTLGSGDCCVKSGKLQKLSVCRCFVGEGGGACSALLGSVVVLNYRMRNTHEEYGGSGGGDRAAERRTFVGLFFSGLCAERSSAARSCVFPVCMAALMPVIAKCPSSRAHVNM